MYIYIYIYEYKFENYFAKDKTIIYFLENDTLFIVIIIIEDYLAVLLETCFKFSVKANYFMFLLMVCLFRS